MKRCSKVFTFIRSSPICRLLIIISLLIVPSYSIAQNWKTFVPEDKVKDQIIQYDEDSKKKVSETITRVWIKIEKKEQTETKRGASPIVKSLYLVEINCNERNYKTIAIAEYDKNGRLVNSLNLDDASWYFIVPESTMSYLQKSICQK